MAIDSPVGAVFRLDARPQKVGIALALLPHRSATPVRSNPLDYPRPCGSVGMLAPDETREASMATKITIRPLDKKETTGESQGISN
ncbi:hypothetical protein [Streptomyces sp. MNU89]|uniref:hypothetical protein n=1 Tax=Streptomyces sp. MNU89 TaxID=2560025 RepID=UPI001E508383|nr:hypothetical protein [Streptomyces sp. MNU89]MCC9742717.1 hypothetical protein [Streptomyces sp. MNU89]